MEVQGFASPAVGPDRPLSRHKPPLAGGKR